MTASISYSFAPCLGEARPQDERELLSAAFGMLASSVNLPEGSKHFGEHERLFLTSPFQKFNNENPREGLEFLVLCSQTSGEALQTLAGNPSSGSTSPKLVRE